MRTITKQQLAEIRNIPDKPDNTARLAEQAIASMRNAVNDNQAIMGEIIHQLSVKPKEFLIVKDNKGDMVKIIPVYDDGR